MADQPMEGENAEVERRIQEERRVMRTAFEREWAERVALVGHAAARARGRASAGAGAVDGETLSPRHVRRQEE